MHCVDEEVAEAFMEHLRNVCIPFMHMDTMDTPPQPTATVAPTPMATPLPTECTVKKDELRACQDRYRINFFYRDVDFICVGCRIELEDVIRECNPTPELAQMELDGINDFCLFKGFAPNVSN